MSSLKDSDKPRAASALINAQTNDDVIDYMLEVPDEQLKTAQGVELLIEKLNEYYAKDTAHLAWAAFYDFWVGRRKRGETAAEFTRQFKQRYAKVTAHDPECKISERRLSLVLLFQLGMSEQSRALVLANMKDQTCAQVVHSVEHLFKGNLPVEDGDDGERSYSSNAENGSALIVKNPDGSLNEYEKDGSFSWISSEHADQHLAFLGFRFPGEGGGPGGKGRRPRQGKQAAPK